MGANPCSQVTTSAGTPEARSVEAVITAGVFDVQHVQQSHMAVMFKYPHIFISVALNLCFLGSKSSVQ